MPKIKSRSKSTKKFKFLLGRSRFQVLVFLLLFASVGSFFIVRSFAATTTSGSLTSCGHKYCYYPVEAKVAFWHNSLRQSYGSQPTYIPLNDCVSSFARGYAAKLATQHHALINAGSPNSGVNWDAEIGKCGNAVWHFENLWKGACKDATDQDANDCAWSVVAGPNGSFLNSSTRTRANMLATGMNAQGVGAFKDTSGTMWIVAEYVSFR